MRGFSVAPYGKPMARPSKVQLFPSLPVTSLGGITWNLPPAATSLNLPREMRILEVKGRCTPLPRE